MTAPHTAAGGRPGDDAPEVNALVELRHDDWDDAASSRAEDTATLPDGTRVVVVSAPSLAGSRRARAHPGDEVEVRWTSAQGLHIAATDLIAAEGDPLPTWALALRRDPTVVQRRGAYRVPVDRRARVRRTADGQEAEGLLADLSETGARLEELADARLGVGDGLHLTMPVDDGTLTLPATVVREHPPPHAHLGVAFTELAPADAQRLRRHLIALQLAQRRATPKE